MLARRPRLVVHSPRVHGADGRRSSRETHTQNRAAVRSVSFHTRVVVSWRLVGCALDGRDTQQRGREAGGRPMERVVKRRRRRGPGPWWPGVPTTVS
jgi:hypothetical protein